jgi:aryl carrier-like protein
MVITTKEVDPAGRPSNIGAPFPTVMGFILDPNGTDLVPYGAVGELCVAGPQVTAGYVGRDDLTKAAFLENVLETSRMYRTGDLARWLPGGELECLGRKDNQVKIHGHRIELAEIEQTILKTDLVHGTAVLAITIKGNKQLVSFCVFNPGPCEILSAEDHAEVARELRAKLSTLASYMIPKYIIPVGDFPKSPSRKTDRKVLTRWVEQLDPLTLSQYAFEGTGVVEEVVPVETKAEETLQEIWSDILGVPPSNIGKNSDFLALGGDSVAAISATSLARKAGYALSVKDILKTPILKDLAESMRLDKRQDPALSKPAYQPPSSVLDAIKSSGLDIDNDVEYGECCK